MCLEGEQLYDLFGILKQKFIPSHLFICLLTHCCVHMKYPHKYSSYTLACNKTSLSYFMSVFLVLI